MTENSERESIKAVVQHARDTIFNAQETIQKMQKVCLHPEPEEQLRFTDTCMLTRKYWVVKTCKDCGHIWTEDR